MRIELGSERSRGVEVNFVFHDRATGCAVDLPAAFVQLAQRYRIAGLVFCPNPVDVLRKVADLIQSVPDWKLEFSRGATRGQDHLHVSQVLLEVHEGDRIADPYGKIPIVRHARGRLPRDGREKRGTHCHGSA